MEFASVKETSQRWGVSASRVRLLASSGRIPGAKMMGRSWFIPADATKPADGRSSKPSAKTASGPRRRLPLYLYSLEGDDPVPPDLSGKEQDLLQAQVHIARCRFAEASRLLEPLVEGAESALTRAAALHQMCVCDMGRRRASSFALHAAQLALLHSDDHDENALIGLIRADLEALYKGSRGLNHLRAPALEGPYPEGLLPYLLSASVYSASVRMLRGEPVPDLTPYELICMDLEEQGRLYTALQAHVYTAVLCYAANDKAGMAHHARRAAAIGYSQDYPLPLAVIVAYMGPVYAPALAALSPDFERRILALGKQFHAGYEAVVRHFGEDQLFAVLSTSDLEYVAMALKGLTNAQIAAAKGLSRVTVGKRFESICSKLSVSSKKELVALAKRTLEDYRINSRC